jgi:hypothetical protein
VLDYTLEQILTQVAHFERDVGTVDGSGGKMAVDWQPSGEVPCRMWWWKGSKSSDKSPSAQFARPQATINVTGGDMAVPLGTDVTNEDRLAKVVDPTNGQTLEGPFRVIAVNEYEDHVELSLERP